MQWKGSILTILVFLSHTHARWKGTGEPCPNFLWKSSKFSLHRFKKYFVFWYPYEPLFHLPYKVWTLTPWFRLWHFWTTVHWLVFKFCILHNNKKELVILKIVDENASLTECYDFQVLKAEPQECLMSFALKWCITNQLEQQQWWTAMITNGNLGLACIRLKVVFLVKEASLVEVSCGTWGLTVMDLLSS